ncbi:MAG: hypothetical protein IJ262_02410 [Clostridia bacterium]|nr:hypothetical protein [Clostridia bacterium]
MSDNDMKVYGGKKQMKQSCANVAATYEAMNFHRTNGNLAKARELGKKLATITPDEMGEGLKINLSQVLTAKYLTQPLMFQFRVMFVFAAETLLQTEIEVPFLATTAINAMHDKLRSDYPGFFKNISDGAAFTFYCLAVKKDEDIPLSIGEAFAMLCNVQKNRDGFVEAGKKVWNIAVEVISKEISAVDFESEN